MPNISSQTVNAVFGILIVAVLVLCALVFYNYYQSGKISYTSFIIAGLILLTAYLSKKSLNKD